MLSRLRQLLLSKPTLIVAGLAATYLLVGFFALPAIASWQLPKQVEERLGQQLTIEKIRFNPLTLRLEVDGLRLATGDGGPLFALRSLRLDLAWRGLVDGAWTVSEFTVEAPELQFELLADGRSNFSALLDRLGPGETKPASGAPPRLVVRQLALSEGRIEFRDRLFDPVRVTRLEAITVGGEGLTTLAGENRRLTVSAHGADKGKLDIDTRLALNPFAINGRIDLQDLPVATLVRAVSRWVDLEASTGTLGLGAGFDLAVAESGNLAGTVKDARLAVAALSLRPAAAQSPLLALETVALENGRIDLARRELAIGTLRLENGSVAATADERGFDWARLVRTPVAVRSAAAASPALAASAASAPAVLAAASVPSPASAASAASAPSKARAASMPSAASVPSMATAASAPSPSRQAASAPGNPWQMAIEKLRLAGISLAISNKPAEQQVRIDTIELQASATAGPARIALGETSLSLAGLSLDSGPDRIALPQLTLATQQGQARFGAAGLAATMAGAHIATPGGITLRSGDSGPALALGKASLQGSLLTLNAASGRLEVVLREPDLAFALLQASAPPTAGPGKAVAGAARQQLALGEASLRSLQLKLSAGPGGIDVALDDSNIKFAALSASTGTTKNAAQRLAFDQASLQSKRVTLKSDKDGLDLKLVEPAMALQALKAADAAAASGLDGTRVTVGAKLLSLAQAAGRLRVAADTPAVTLDGLALRQRDDAIELRALKLGAATLSMEQAGGTLQSELGAAQLDASGLQARQGQARATLKEGTLSLSKLNAAIGSAAPELRGQGVDARLAGLDLRGEGGIGELLRIDTGTLAGGRVDTGKRRFDADRLALAGAGVKLAFDDQGRLGWARLVPASPPGAAATAAPAKPSTPPWRVALKAAEISELKLGFLDQRHQPALAVDLDAVSLRADGLDTGTAVPARIALRASVAGGGGSIAADGLVRADDGAADLQLTLSDIKLAPVQPFIAQVARLKLASGTLSAQGRLRQGGDAGARLAYAGSVAVRGFQLDETKGRSALLAWKSLAAPDITLTLAPNRLDIGELRLDAPSGRLLIAEDRSINVTDVMIKADTKDGAQATPASDAPPAEPAFPVTVARVRVADGVLEFADLSLRPQFATRMHELRGVITGLGTDPERSAKVQLDARVDQFGSARIRGELRLLNPAQRTDIEMTFRNIELTAMSPYAVRFAGRRLVGGRLALDLQYRLQDNKLQGENKIVLTKVKLGDKVPGPDALDLPLDLAVAMLEDADGVIDLGIPVRGDLSKPDFDYGAVISKAIGKVLGGIITAPFRALAALLGSDQKALDRVDFEPGLAVLSPPEREQLAAVAKALGERPTLRLLVSPTLAPTVDAAALKSLAVRQAIVQRMDIALEPGEDPGPVDTANPRVQKAIDEVFTQRYAPEVLAALKRRGAEASPPQAPAALYGGILSRLIGDHTLPEQALTDLAGQRAQTVLRDLTERDGLAATRVDIGPAQQDADADKDKVTMRLKLQAAR